MRIDTHQHFWRYQAADYGWISQAMPVLRRDCLPADSAPVCAAAGVDACVAVQARSSTQETDALLDLAVHNAAIVGVVGWVDLQASDLSAALERWSEQPRLRGFRHILQDEADVAAWLATPAVQRGMQQLQMRQLSYDVLVYQRQLPLVAAWCAQHDQHWLVLDHLGKPALADWPSQSGGWAHWCAAIERLAALPHVAVKLSGLVTETAWTRQKVLSDADWRRIQDCFDFALEAFGPERLLFGSDWPVCQLAAPYADVAGLAQRWAGQRLSVAEQQAFWSDNAKRIYGLLPLAPAPSRSLALPCAH